MSTIKQFKSDISVSKMIYFGFYALIGIILFVSALWSFARFGDILLLLLSIVGLAIFVFFGYLIQAFIQTITISQRQLIIKEGFKTTTIEISTIREIKKLKPNKLFLVNTPNHPGASAIRKAYFEEILEINYTTGKIWLSKDIYRSSWNSLVPALKNIKP